MPNGKPLRITITLHKDIGHKIRELFGELIASTDEHWNFTRVINVVLQCGFGVLEKMDRDERIEYLTKIYKELYTPP